MIGPTAPLEAGALILQRDPTMQALGLVLLESAPGRAVVRLQTEGRHLNAAGVVHGGVLFTLADGAFAVAANNDGQQRLAAHAAIEFLRPAILGDTLTATATLITASIYDVAVHDQHGEAIALLRGRASRPRTQGSRAT